MQALEEAMRSDKAPNKILQFNDFGLVAITRKRVKQSLERTLCSSAGKAGIKATLGGSYEELPSNVVDGSRLLVATSKLLPRKLFFSKRPSTIVTSWARSARTRPSSSPRRPGRTSAAWGVTTVSEIRLIQIVVSVVEFILVQICRLIQERMAKVSEMSTPMAAGSHITLSSITSSAAMQSFVVHHRFSRGAMRRVPFGCRGSLAPCNWRHG